jgi:hypothetical protein
LTLPTAGYDPVKSFAPVGMIASGMNHLVLELLKARTGTFICRLQGL